MFSSFVEHLGRAVYGGIYEPTHPTADANGFRDDVASLVKDLNINLVRYPGGNFVSNYNWEDGIGPKDKRPMMRDEAWKSFETNQIGIDEFMLWCKKTNTEPMIAVNLGTGTTDSARNLIEYCNSSRNGQYSRRRRENGFDEPYGIRYWCLGNEMDGDWQIGHLPVKDYCAKAHEAAVKMREVDPNAKFIVCGSSTIDLPTFPEWDRVVCEMLYDEMDYLSVHQYFFESTTESDYYASYLAMEKYISTLRGVLTFAKAKRRAKKDVYLCFDEFNIWYNNKKLHDDFVVAPPILEERQSLKDTIVFGGVLNSLLNNCDIVKIACLAQLVNVIAPIATINNGPVLKNMIYYPYQYFSTYCQGEALKTFVLSGETFDSRFGEARYISQAIVSNDKEVVILLCNYAKEETLVDLELHGYEHLRVCEHTAMFGDDLNAFNDFNHSESVIPQKLVGYINIKNDSVFIKLPKSSWNIIRLSHK